MVRILTSAATIPTSPAAVLLAAPQFSACPTPWPFTYCSEYSVCTKRDGDGTRADVAGYSVWVSFAQIYYICLSLIYCHLFLLGIVRASDIVFYNISDGIRVFLICRHAEREKYTTRTTKKWRGKKKKKSKKIGSRAPELVEFVFVYIFEQRRRMVRPL